MTKAKKSPVEAPKVTAEKSQANKVPSAWRVKVFWVAAVLMLILVGWWQTQPMLAPASAHMPVGSGASMEEAPVVARTQPEVGEEMPQTIINKTEDGTKAASITVLNQPELPVVDVTAHVKAQAVPQKGEVQQAQALNNARLAQATLQLSSQVETQRLRLITLYTAVNTSAPEAPYILEKALADATDEHQVKILKTLRETLIGTGTVTQQAVLAAWPQGAPAVQVAPVQPAPVKAAVTTPTAPPLLPTWWQQTLGRWVSIQKIEDVPAPINTAPAPQATPVVNAAPQSAPTALAALLYQGRINEAQAFMENFTTQEYRQVHSVLARYAAQRQALVAVLDEALK